MTTALATVSELPQPRKPSSIAGGELGVTLDLPFGTWNEEIYNPNEINVPDLLPRLDQMQRNDGHMRALYRLLSLPFRRANWRLEEADGGGAEEADLVNQIFTRPPYEGGMTTSFDYIRALGSKAMVNGFQVWEKVWDVQEVPGHGMCTVLRKLAPRAAKTIRFRADANGGFDGVVQRAYAPMTGYRQVLIPKEKCFFFTVDKEEHPFYGRSMFEPALYHYDKKHKLYYIAHIAAQMGAVPGRLGYEDEEGALTPDQKIEFRTALANFGFNTAMMVPRGFRVEPFASNGSIGGEILSLINHHNIQCSQSILGQFLDLGQADNAVGSYALSKDSSDLFIMCMETLLNSFSEHLSWYVIPDIINLNFSSKKYPTFCFDPLADDMKAAIVTIFEALATAKDQHVTGDFMFELEKQVAEKLGLDIDYEKIEQEREKAKDSMDTVTKAVAGLYGPGVAPPEPPAPPPAPGDPAGPPAPQKTPQQVAKLAENYLAIELATNRDKLGKFARINELVVGAGKPDSAQAQYAPIVNDVQTKLAHLGYEPEDDGVYGTATAAALKQFQVDNGLPGTGRLDLGTYSLVLTAHAKTRMPATA